MEKITNKKVISFLLLFVMVFSVFFVSASVNTAYAKYVSPLEGERVFIAGDSLNNPAKASKYGAFVQKTAQNMGAKKITNKAVSCAALANVRNDKAKSLYKQVFDMGSSLKNYDVYFIVGGTNDYGGGGKGRAAVDKTKDSLEKIINKIHKVNPDGIIIVITPLYRHSYNDKTADCETKKNSYKKTLPNYRNGIEAVAKKLEVKKNVILIKGTSLATKAQMYNKKNTVDGLHPTATFAKNVLAKKLKIEIDKKLVVEVVPVNK